MNRNKALALMVVPLMSLLVLSACASHDKKMPKMSEVFVTNITQDGSKRFNYAMVVAKGEKGGRGARGGSKAPGGKSGGRGGRGAGRGGKGGSEANSSTANQQQNNEKIAQRMTEKLNRKLEQTAYCRDGYIELNSYFSRGRSQIRGECKEGATEDDRQTFINQNYL
ncbi:MAG: hypothetical protein ACI8WB_001587 [Phenylobacterium sp.]|jgi:hypothetical protein